MRLVANGLMNKQIAGEMALSEITVKIHRGRVMKKMAARSVADLVRMEDQIRAWLDQFWDVALDAFKAEVERTETEEPS